MTRIVWTEPAVADLQAIVDYIGRDSELYASATAERIVAAVGQLERFARSGRVGSSRCWPSSMRRVTSAESLASPGRADLS
ncbi:MAG: type II toxin-antitoxin system RelE/ParE family toxin [Deltaproteobacteria bacterium]|nr:type II toxin-antitoxin system RelE/ParE family toxin [Deltaproteobacteria bacterium]